MLRRRWFREPSVTSSVCSTCAAIEGERSLGRHSMTRISFFQIQPPLREKPLHYTSEDSSHRLRRRSSGSSSEPGIEDRWIQARVSHYYRGNISPEHSYFEGEPRQASRHSSIPVPSLPHRASYSPHCRTHTPHSMRHSSPRSSQLPSSTQQSQTTTE